MGAVGVIILVIIAAVYGAAAHFFPGYPGRRTSFDGIIVFVVALLTGFIANIIRKGEGPQVDGLYYAPVAVIAASGRSSSRSCSDMSDARSHRTCKVEKPDTSACMWRHTGAGQEEPLDAFTRGGCTPLRR